MVTNLTSICEDVVSIHGLAQWVRGSGTAVSCGMSHRRGSQNLVWLWAWAGSCSSKSISRVGTSICHGCSTNKKREINKYNIGVITLNVLHSLHRKKIFLHLENGHFLATISVIQGAGKQPFRSCRITYI